MTKSVAKYIFVGLVSIGLLSIIVSSDAKVSPYNHAKDLDDYDPYVAVDTPITPVTLHYNFNDQSTGDPLTYPNGGGLMLNNPSNIHTNVDYDPTSGNYIMNQTMGGIDYRPPTYMESEEYQDYMFKKQVKSYWEARAHADSKNAAKNATIPKLHVGGEIFDRIFGGNTVDIRPNGSAELIFAYNATKTENPALPVKQRKIHTFDFNEKIQLNVIGKIGDKLKLTASYNTESTFDYENQMKLEYTGYEDEIIKKIEAGNVSMPLSGSLITGSQTLFGIKTQLQFGRLTVTSILSQQKGKKSEVESAGGAQVTKYEIAGDNYEANKHFFLAQYFRDNYNSALAGLPFINSQINISKIEVWVSNTNNVVQDIRSVVGFEELGEGSPGHIPSNLSGTGSSATGTIVPHEASPYLPDNFANSLYEDITHHGYYPANGLKDTTLRVINYTVSGINNKFHGKLQQTAQFEILNAKKLQPTEYTFNPKLGFISLNQQLNPDQVLCVAYRYTYNGNVYTVGDFSEDEVAPKALFVKLLKSSATNTRAPLWDLMMKNVYSIGSYQINPADFKLDVFYNNSKTGTDINYLPVSSCQAKIVGKPLLQVLSFDKLNSQNDQTPDGQYDFIDGVTINATTGRIILPVVEPFGDYLQSKFTSGCDPFESGKYVFHQLYDSTRVQAQQLPNLNRFKLKGSYKSMGGSEISLGAPNVPQGSVTVTAGGVKLTENVDYTVDYTLGRVKVINEGILNSGAPIKVSLESNALFAIQQKTLMGTHLDFKINKDFSIGGTIMNLKERPLTKKVNIGDEPINNTIWGLDGNYRTDAPWLTRLIDKLPFLATKEMSTITASAEYAYLIPGHNKVIGKNGNAYIDDFEGSTSTIDLRSQGAWNLASTPQGQPQLFKETAVLDTSLTSGYNRAKLAWYVIDPMFLRPDGNTPSVITTNVMSNNFTRQVPETEVFPNKQSPNGVPVNIATLDMAYYPSERGPYNYDTHPTTVSKGLASDGSLNNPETRWGGAMRAISSNDFEAANIEYIQFWVMDPFNDDNPVADWNSTGNLYFNLGNVSEDILHDNYKSAENALPAPSTPAQTISTAWGIVPNTQPLINAFNSDPGDRPYQDVGLDGLSDGNENTFFSNYIAAASAAGVTGTGLQTLQSDPSADDYHYFRGQDYDNAGVLTRERYKKFNGLEGNSAIVTSGYPTAATTLPNVEDINHDNNLSTVESYFQYHISLKPNDFTSGVGTNYITNVFHTTGQAVQNGNTKPITWYQFKIPIKSPELRVGSIENFQSIRFIRMFFKDVDKPILLRFARLELVRDEWRKYGFDLLSPGLYIPNDDDLTLFDVGAVNIEENGSKQPVNYVLPPNIDREINASSANLTQLNEQALAITICNLADGKARAAYKNTELDVRNYHTLKMYIHGEASTNTAMPLYGNDLSVFVRLGTDYTDNYYEYSVPLQITAPGTYTGTNEADQYKVWPSANEMVLEFDKLLKVKEDRNNLLHAGNNISLTTEYTEKDGTRKITVKGNPTLSSIKTIMIGIKNPKKRSPADNEDGLSDDGLSKCGQVWVNELRLTDFDQKGGWAANARVTAKLADLGSLSLSGSTYTPGFGSLENKVDQRKKETMRQYDISSSLELGKFLPKDAGIHVPMYIGRSETFITPKYNPLDPDILLLPQLKGMDKHDKDSLKSIVQDYTKRNSLNFTNVKKDKGKNVKKAHIYDISNFSASYSYTEIFKRNVNVEYNDVKNYRGGFIYSFSPQPKNIKPLAKIPWLQSNYLALIRDVNFYLKPTNIGFSSDLIRTFATAKDRNTTGDDIIINPTFNKQFNFNRSYTLKYDITKALKFDFSANNLARIFEPAGDIDTKQKKDTILNNLLNLGKTSQYNHQVNLNYTIPINKIPYLDFTSASVKYTGTYTWQHSPLYDTKFFDDGRGNLLPVHVDTLGNTIQNSRNIQWNGQINMTTLYNKIPYFKKVNSKAGGGKSVDPKAGGKLKDVNPNDSTKKKNTEPHGAGLITARLLMSLKTVTVTYAMIDGILLSGYNQSTQMLGMDSHFNAPTTGFVFGSQKDIRQLAIDNSHHDQAHGNDDWLVHTQSLNTPYTTTWSRNLNIKANLEPMPDLKVELSALHTQSRANSEFFKWGGVSDPQFVHQSPTESGNFSMSFSSYRTSFMKGDAVFGNFLDNRQAVSLKLGQDNPYSRDTIINGYSKGYNPVSQEVLIPAFLEAYSGKISGKASTTVFPKVPKPNWRITYDGLSKLKQVKKYFKTVTLSHAYRSTYSVGGYNSNLLFHGDEAGHTPYRDTVSTDPNPNYFTEKIINTVTISEQWSPLIKCEVIFNNSISLNFEYKKDRTISLGLTSKAITEIAGREIIAGAGYRIPGLQMPAAFTIKGKRIKADLNLKGDLSFRKNITTIRRIVEGVSQPTGGTNIISIKVSADYVINTTISIRLFYDHIINKPVISSSFPTTNTNAGISLRLTLAN